MVEEQMKNRYNLTCLVIFRSRPALRNSLLSHNGFRVLIDILSNHIDEDIFTNAVLAIQELAKTLRFQSLGRKCATVFITFFSF
jgi:hypothetical protein